MVRRAWIPVLAVVLLLVLAGAANAKKEEGTKTVEAGDHIAIEIEKSGDEDLDVRYFIAVTAGPAIDVFFMDEESYADYLNETDFDYYPEYSTLDVTNVDKAFVWDELGVYYVVIDNTDSGTLLPEPPEEQNATLRYIVTWNEVEKVYWLRDFALMLVVVCLVFFGLVIVYLFMERSKRTKGKS
jgi:hypothetical protein